MLKTCFQLEAGGGHLPAEADSFIPRANRLLTILLVGRMVTNEGDDLCRVRNISTGGMMIESSVPLATGQRVTVELRSLFAVKGTIMWAKAPHAGVLFNAAADVVGLLRSTSSKDGRAHQPRSPRLNTECPILVRRDGQLSPAKLLDLSQNGGRALFSNTPIIDELITVSVPGLGARRAVVRWTREGATGFTFLTTVPFGELEFWLRDHSVRFAKRT